MIVSIDRHAVAEPYRTVHCPVRDAEVPVEACLMCGLLLRAEPPSRPNYVVCDGYAVRGWLGLDA